MCAAGVNNDFLIKTADPLALLYNDRSPLEMHHVASASSVLKGLMVGPQECSKLLRIHLFPEAQCIITCAKHQMKHCHLWMPGVDDCVMQIFLAAQAGNVRWFLILPTHLRNVLQARNPDAALLTRAATIELVLGTDMKQHFNILSLFQVQALNTFAW